MSDPKILVVEDEPSQQELLVYNLEKAGFRVVATGDGEDGVAAAQDENPALIVLDWMLPGLSGIEVCRQLRRDADTRQIPIIMLTARGEEGDKVRALDTGADDYIVKPYSVAELLARVRAHIRRANPAEVGEMLEHGDIKLDPSRMKVERSGTGIKLGPTEFRLLTVFLSRPGRVWTRESLLERVWEHDLDIDQRTVDVHVGRLRRALKVNGLADPIRTIRSAGYSLDFED